MRSIPFISGLSVLLGFSAAAQLPIVLQTAPESAGWHERSISHDGLTRWFLLYRPVALPERAPVLLLLHGGTGSMRTIFRSSAGATREWPYLAEREKFLLVVPNGVSPDTGDTYGDSQNWNDLRAPGSDRETTADDIGFINWLIDHAVVQELADPLRVYLTGASNGGGLTQRFVMNHAGKVAAAASFISNLPLDNEKFREPSRPVPFLFGHGTEDPMMLYGGVDGVFRSAEDTLVWWAARNGTAPLPGAEIFFPDLNPNDFCRIGRRRFEPLSGGAPVEHLRVVGGGHSMPSILHQSSTSPVFLNLVGRQCRDAENAVVTWEFMSQFSIPLQPQLELSVIAPAQPGLPTFLNLEFKGGYPSGSATLEGREAFDSDHPWTELASVALDELGGARFPEISHSGDAPKKYFYRASTQPKSD
ncbi:MAG: hypothetical protein MUF13_15535 [Akkermansiaceae bacterium]|nr:hypothetical protein [Akkermansiaceae bacterium]